MRKTLSGWVNTRRRQWVSFRCLFTGVVHYLSDATFLTTLPDGTVSEGSVKKGDVQWREFTRHAVENIGTTDARAFAIELK